MSWRDPGALWLLILLPLFAAVPVFAWWTRRRATHRFGAPETVQSLVVGRSGPWRAARATIAVLALGLMIVAYAGPRYGSRTKTIRKAGLDLVVALDFSKSMLAEDIGPNRIERAKAEVLEMVRELDGDRVGVVAFAGETMEFPLTVDDEAIRLFLSGLGPYDMPVGGTAVGRALVASKRLLERSNPQQGSEQPSRRSQVVILVTDGEDHEGDPQAAAAELADAGVRLFVVGVGSQVPEPIPTYAPDGTRLGYQRDEDDNVVTSALTADNERQLREMAQRTGGEYFQASRDRAGLAEVRQAMASLHREEREARRVTVHEPRFVFALFPAFLLLLLEGLLPDAWLGRRRRVRAEPRSQGGAK